MQDADFQEKIEGEKGTMFACKGSNVDCLHPGDSGSAVQPRCFVCVVRALLRRRAVAAAAAAADDMVGCAKSIFWGRRIIAFDSTDSFLHRPSDFWPWLPQRCVCGR
jgi:hypothetical protein